jgi:2-C-methyl-D-erythritol 4-phosphate cytidylyltransferase / 2-C-methyl-D-erythritol 2,4-cyclodiphosphate synthase
VLVAALIVAAGRGSRATGATGGLAKQYAIIGGQAVLTRTIEALAGHASVDRVCVVIHADDQAAYAYSIRSLSPLTRAKLVPPVTGGATRQQSVRLGLQALAALPPSHVLIHDAARPFVDAAVISRVIDALRTSPGAIAATPVADTLKKANDAGAIEATVDRDQLWRAQTPQGFAFSVILPAHETAAVKGLHSFTDDAAIAEWAGLSVALVEGSEANTKITTAEDLHMAELRMDRQHGSFETRIGTGFDVHRFTEGDHVWLCGVKVPHTHKLEGHSDADVALHALTDALLGAIGDGDIGQHFPPSDPQWKGAASHLFLADACRRTKERGGTIVNVDITLLAEAPRIGPHREAMQRAIADVLNIDTSRIGIKATTTEGLGFVGRREGLAAMASATVRLPC